MSRWGSGKEGERRCSHGWPEMTDGHSPRNSPQAAATVPYLFWDHGEQTLRSPPWCSGQISYFRQRESYRKKKHTPYSLAEEI